MAHPIELFYKLRECYNATRRAGTTVALSIAAKNSGLMIVSPTADSARLISREIAFDSPGAAISLPEFFRYIHGRRPCPWALDNHTVGYLCDKAIEGYEYLMKMVKDRDSEISKLVAETKQLEKAWMDDRQAKAEVLFSVRALQFQLEEAEDEIFKLNARLAVRKMLTIKVMHKRH